MTAELRQESLGLLRRALDNLHAEFRDGQWEAIEALFEQRARLLLVQRTGWGKSLVYFIATRLLRDQGSGVTLLISPLLSLMRNQIQAADRLGVRAVTVNSSNTDEWALIKRRLLADDVDLLLISPERLADDAFRERALLPVASRVGLFVVDEAHCISDWGHDFRPDYRRVKRVLDLLPANIPVLATTATANNRVVDDVLSSLGRDVRLVRGPLMRRGLRLENITLPGQSARMSWLAEHLPNLPGTGIIYSLTVRDAQRVAAWLQARGINARAYWGGLENAERVTLEGRLLNNQIKALVATSALGMGFDKPDLGFVVHYQRPGSVVHYYQQVGRAGRALDSSYGILLGGREDQDIVDYFIRTAFPPEAHVADVLFALRRVDGGLSIPALEEKVNLSRSQIEKVLKSLAVKSPAPVSRQNGHWHANPVRYEPDRQLVKRLTAVRHAEQATMSEYMNNRECLMMFLARELDDPRPEPCGLCAVCVGGTVLPKGSSKAFDVDGSTLSKLTGSVGRILRGGAPVPYSTATAKQAIAFLRQNDQFLSPRRQWPPEALSQHGWRGPIPAGLRVQAGRALSVWGDDGWGQVVRDGKQAGRFDDALVSAVVSMILGRWRPKPAPAWVTAVPSLNHPEFVPRFAGRVAGKLGLKFVPSVTKTRRTEPQKLMQNSHQQAHNLEGAFMVEAWKGISGPVLLVDDMVDSGWTMTVVGALLREAGSGPVFPLALTVTSGAN